MQPGRRKSGRSRAFTLVELLVSIAVLALLMVLLVSITDATRASWSDATAKTQQFREAREAFEAITRRLSQATLNTYWDYSYPNNDQTRPPTAYVRQSELRFISGPGNELGLGANRTTHGIFFQAPLGYVSGSTYSRFRNLLNTWGYFVEYGSDQSARPAFINASILPYRNRFRLMELMEPSESMTLYQKQAMNGGAAAYNGREWFAEPLASAANVGVVAENIIAQVILPKLSAADQASGNYTDGSLAPNYLYDSTGLDMSTSADASLNPRNQLPPVVQVTMVALDELSASRLGDAGAASLKTWLGSHFSDPMELQSDLKNLEKYLVDNRIKYRIFTSNVSIRASKWSRTQEN